MRGSLPTLCLVLASGWFWPGETLHAQSLEETLAKTRRELEVLQIQHRLFWQVDYARELRELDAAIRFMQAETRLLEQGLRHYRDRHEVRYGGALLDERQKSELALLDAELRLKNLREERLALRRTAPDRVRLLELKIAGKRAELVELERLRLAD